MSNSVSLKCSNPTKTLTKDKKYQGIPVKKSGNDGTSYNSRYTTNWIECTLEECTSFRIYDDLLIRRFISIKRFAPHFN